MASGGEARRPIVAIIDDEVDITTYLRLALEDNGYQVVVINEAGRALERVRDTLPDVILLDLLMPEMTGASLYGRIASDPLLGRTPVVILSGLEAREDLPGLLARQGGGRPPRAFIDKPVDIEEVLSIIGSILATGAKGDAA